jgi:hypothetical protein
MFQEMLDEKIVFKSLFFQNIYDPNKDERRQKKQEREKAIKEATEAAIEERRRREAALEEGEELADHDIAHGAPVDGDSDEEDELYYGPPPIPLKLYVDKITSWFHPFDVSFVYFTRLDRGPIAEPANEEVLEGKMSSASCVAAIFWGNKNFTFFSSDAAPRLRGS